MIFRSMLFTPGNNMRMIDKASRLETDAIILDLEDAVPIRDKETARIFIRDSVDVKNRRQHDPFPHLKSTTSLNVYVRVNALLSGFFEEDLNYVVVDGLDGLMIPKSETGEDIVKIDKLLEEKEMEIGFAKGRISLIPLIETARGVINAYSIASASKRVIALGFGAVDFAADARILVTKISLGLLYPRSYISIAAHASGVQPIDTPWVDIQDVDGLIRDCKVARSLGFTGKMAIHPIQLKPINKTFSPSKGEIEYAKKIVKSFKEAVGSGKGAISFNGKMIDYANLRQAEEVLELAMSMEKGKTAKRNL